IIPLYKIFSFPFKKENISLENIQNVVLMFPPKSDFAKCKDLEAIQAELLILQTTFIDLGSINFLSIIEKCEEVKHNHQPIIFVD
ncbi:hypothetical protein P9421_25085, partial [Escherichia coli]|uniref:hypothetical protein n=1 Tax=Escherichia coli TaxID=562 RepID=UPI0038911F9E